MRRLGVSAGTSVVVYDAATSVAASRLWWLLTDAGHQRVRVLDGGFAAWQRAEQPIETGPENPRRPGGFAVAAGRRRRWTAAEVAALTSNGPSLVDVRAADRYAGENETIDPLAGHIPGALSRPTTENLTATGEFRSAAEIAERFADLTAEPVLYCGSGITAAHTLLALESAGLTGAIYPGSWSDWIADPARPRSTGPRP
ncbi:MAG: sulfurtransferase, partial [Microlunatus sp.]|nr:sulfurtransferase [Microlunatus sp.]